MTDDEHEARRIEQVVADAERFQSDPDAFCRLLTPEVVLVNVAGTRLVGRDAVRRAMEAALQTPLADVITRNEVQRIAVLRPEVAVVNGIKRVFLRQDGDLAESFHAIQTFVLVRDQGAWQIAVVQNTPVRGAESRPAQAAVAEPSTAVREVAAARAVAIPGGFGLRPPDPRRQR